MRWVEFSVHADGETAEAVADLFNRYGHGGVAVEELEQPEMRIGPQEVRADQRTVRVSTYVPVDEGSTDALVAARHQIVDGLGYLAMIRPMRGGLMEREVADEDWASAWKEHFHVHRPGERTVVVPTWREYEPEDEDIVIRLDPGMAFGTGLHPSTRLCVRELEHRVLDGTTVLDVGTGSGILSIVAAKLGAKYIRAVEIDPVAVTAARENLQANGISEEIVEIEEGSLPSPRQDPFARGRAGWPPDGFDIVVANITADVLAELSVPLAAAVAPGGTLIGSGIIGTRFVEAVDALAAVGLRLIDAVSEGDWRAIICQRIATST
jgi:ribosomal protein L11 methyltransferase